MAGVLLGGVGTGIALVEYSSLAYGGEKLIGEDSLVTKTLDFDFEPDGRTLEIREERYWRTGKEQEIEVDNTVPVGTVRFEVTYNQKTVTPGLAFQEYEEEAEAGSETIWEEQQDMEHEWEELESESVQIYEEENTDNVEMLGEEGQDAWAEPSEAEGEAEDLPLEKEKPGKRGTVYLTASYHENGFATLMENKDYMLEELKQGKISSYSMAYITDVKIRVNQETVPYIKGCYVIH